jgi:shikimate kinase
MFIEEVTGTKLKNNCFVLIGMAGAGKSTIGLGLAKALKFSFTDLDQHIQEADGLSIQNVIDTQGEEALLRLEEQRMREIARVPQL